MSTTTPEWIDLFAAWLRQQTATAASPSLDPNPRQSLLWSPVAYQEDAPAIRGDAELEAALEHLEFAVYRRYQNQLTRAERGRLENTVQNAMFKIDRYLARMAEPERGIHAARYETIRDQVRESREGLERRQAQARRAELKLAQLGSLTPEGFEEFVAELFEALGYEVDRVGGTGDDGADLRMSRNGQLAVVQCKYHRSAGVIGSPELRRFLGTVHHMHCHKGYFVTTRTYSLAAEKFAAEHPIELIDGPRLVELVEEALGPVAKREKLESWF